MEDTDKRVWVPISIVMVMTRTSLLFLSGAGLPDWIWDATRAALPEEGVVASRPAARDADVSAYARSALDCAPEGQLTLVAHSAGGVIATEICALAPERVRGVLAVAAVIPKNGHSFTSSMPFPNRIILPVILKFAGTRPPESAIRNTLAAGVDEASLGRLIEDFSPETRTYFTSRVSSELTVPVRGYLRTTDDQELPAALQRVYAARLQPTFTRALSGGHLPMLTQPNQLAAVIAEFHAKVSGYERDGG